MSVSSGGSEPRSASTRSSRSPASAGRATFSRPTRHAAFNRRAGGTGLIRDHSERRLDTRPSRSRSAATRPPTVTTAGDWRSCRSDRAPAIRNASRRPSRSGSTHRSTSSGRSGSPNVSATGPGPNTGPVARASSPTAVIGRLCSSTSAPLVSIAHSMSCGPPNVSAVRRASLTSLRRVRRDRSSAGTSSPASCSRPRTESVSWTPSICPLTSRSGPPGTAATTRRSVRPVTGSAPNSTPPHDGWRNGCTSTAIGASPPDCTTSSTAARNASQPCTSSTDVNSPAIDCDPPSSTVEDERTTSERRPVSDRACHASCSASAWRRAPRRWRGRGRRPSSP